MDIETMTRIELQARIVYIIAEVGSGGRMYKVGISKNFNSLGRRLQNLQTGNPRQLSIIHTFEYQADGEAYKIEQETIKAFSFYQLGVTGDWFELEGSNSLVQFITNG